MISAFEINEPHEVSAHFQCRSLIRCLGRVFSHNPDEVLLQLSWEHSLMWGEPVSDQIKYIWNRWHEEPQGLKRTQEVHFQEQSKEHIATPMAVHSQLKSHESAIVLVMQEVDNQAGDIVFLQEEPMAPKWPIVWIIQVHLGQDGRVCVVTS